MKTTQHENENQQPLRHGFVSIWVNDHVNLSFLLSMIINLAIVLWVSKLLVSKTMLLVQQDASSVMGWGIILALALCWSYLVWQSICQLFDIWQFKQTVGLALSAVWLFVIYLFVIFL